MKKKDRTVVSIEDRIPKLKEARKKKANRRLVFYMIIFFVLISIIVYLQSPLSYVKSIQIEGNRYLTDEEVISLSGLSEEANIWSLDFVEMENNLTSGTVIEEATVERKLPSTVVIGIEEKQIVGIIKQDELYYPLLNNGEILTSASYPNFNGEAPLIIGFTNDEFLHIFANELSKLPIEILDLISEMHWLGENEGRNEVLFYMNDGYVVQGTLRNFADGMRVYPSVVSQLEPDVNGIIHMGIGVYFEALDENEEQTEESDNTADEDAVEME